VKNVAWDNSYFDQKNNPFCKNWLISCEEKAQKLVVTEVNRTTPCCSCGRLVDEVSGSFLEIKQQYYCSPCGSKQLNQK
jgi:hypothetical protein